MTLRNGELLFEIIERLSRAGDAETSWVAIIDAARRIGAVAVNGGAIRPETREILWARSSMDAGWRKEYTAKRFHEVDPLLWGMRTGCLPELHPAGVALPGMPSNGRQAAMREGLLRRGYRWFWANLWRADPVEKMVALAAEDDPRDRFGADTPVLIRTVSALMAARLMPPETATAVYGAHTAYKALSLREADALRCLAEGLDNQRIAERLGVAEVTVRMHLRNAKAKMGAQTREQALALALARGAVTL